jgi:hypothetical protein
LEIAPDDGNSPEGKSSNLEHSPAADRKQARRKELAAIHTAQVAHDRPYAEAVRKMMRNLEESAGLSDLRYVMAVHRHTDKTHIHLLLRRECTMTKTGEKTNLHRLPETFLNGRDEQGKARGGLLDIALSDALDTMIPRRRRAARTEAAEGSRRPSQQLNERQQADPEDPATRSNETRTDARHVRHDSRPDADQSKRRPVFITTRPTDTPHGCPTTATPSLITEPQTAAPWRRYISPPTLRPICKF